MTKFFDDITAAVGHTPLVRINKLIRGGSTVLAKLESLNPLASVKDRIGVSMINAGERDGKIHAKTLIIEPTSGNTPPKGKYSVSSTPVPCSSVTTALLPRWSVW